MSQEFKTKTQKASSLSNEQPQDAATLKTMLLGLLIKCNNYEIL